MGGLTIGVDVGTTATKAVVLDVDAGVVAQTSRPSRLSSPRPGWAEASTEEWMANVRDTLAELVASPVVDRARVTALSVTGMVPAVVPLDARGRPLRPAILQNDARATREVGDTAEQLKDHDVVLRTGSAVTQQSVGPTATWLATHEPDVWARTTSVVGSYDLVLAALGAEVHVERNWALESGLYTVAGDPFAPAVEVAGMAQRLVPVRTAGEVVGALSPGMARETGLPAGVPLVVGGADHVLSAFTAGLSREGDWLIKLGGAGDILAVAAEPVMDPRFYLDEHPVPGLWLPNGCMATSGSLIRWVQGIVGDSDLARLDDEAAGRPAAEVLCLPYFLGEKSPLNDPHLRGVFAGMHLGHDRADLYRSVLEGIAFGFRHNAEALRDAGVPLERATVTNGGSTSRFWRAVHASVLGSELRSVRGHTGASLGAAVLAGIGTGVLSWADAGRFVETGEVIAPDASLVDRYEEAYGLWRALGAAVEPVAHAMSRRTGH